MPALAEGFHKDDPDEGDANSPIARSSSDVTSTSEGIAGSSDFDQSGFGSVHSIEVDSAGELARNLPDLIEQLKMLRTNMERSSNVFESMVANAARASNLGAGDDLMPTLDEQNEFHERASASAPVRQHSGGHNDSGERPSLVRTSISKRSQHMHNGPRASLTNSMMNTPNSDYSIMWVSGECGISLRNFSAKKIGAQIAVLQQANGVTTGISNCRLGDQLIAINGEEVEDLRFKEIVQKLKETRRPITLAFRTNPNVQTSPTSAGRSANRGSSANRFSMTNTQRNSLREFFPPEDDFDRDSMPDGMDGQDWMPRDTLRTSIASEDLEMWRRQQEAMHSDIIVLLTETVLRCEKLQQENLDQLQILMQLSPPLEQPPLSRDSSAPLSLSSLAPVSTPDEASFRASSFDNKQTSISSESSTTTPATSTA